MLDKNTFLSEVKQGINNIDINSGAITNDQLLEVISQALENFVKTGTVTTPDGTFNVE